MKTFDWQRLSRRLRGSWPSLALLVLLFSASGAQAQKLTMLRAQGGKVVDAGGKEVVLRGFNVGGWLLQESYILKTDTLDSQARIRGGLLRTMSDKELEDFYADYRAKFVTKADIDFVAAQGFNCVRLPFHYDLFLTRAQRLERNKVSRRPRDSKALDAYVQSLTQWYDQNQLFTDAQNLDGFRVIDEVLSWCAARNMYVILDLHAAPGGQGFDRNINDNFLPLDLWKRKDAKGRLIYQDITVRLWEKLSARYQNDPRVAMYDFINEPHKVNAENGLSNDNAEISALYSRLITAVRRQNDQHLVLLEGNGYGNEYTNLTPDKLQISDRRNIVYNAHRYWCPNDPAATDPNPNQINLINNLVAFRTKWQVPVWVGETGENSNEWFAGAVQGLNAQNIGWCHWNLKRVEGVTSLLRVRAYGSILTPEGRTALLRNIQFKECLPNRDVIAALTGPATARTPYAALSIPGTIHATDYDMGRNGIAYQDAYAERIDYRKEAPTNNGSVYRNDGIDIQVNPDKPSNGFAISDMAAGEWVNYTVTVTKAGTYTLQARVKNDTSAPARLTVKLDDTAIGTLAVPQTPPTAPWTTISVPTTTLPAGRHTLQLYVEQPGASLSWLQFNPSTTPTTQGGQ
ncbi:cellulase family glycosylhydrolase [Hymenobacter chitinivorans]|uniref:Carbohydrate binding protein with CBM6 domain n=1 Tax=Hymenobacter chitinivorans DSM 11115 TaxID=1121954 RepID=A0A2M9B4U1_9BACT|nr:cellulase family glycosylhydrolase [Hymenobacter chitinivorans]PJJ52957.1 carbohydrate binding protein with CBM6 domain [Hymenobacter chitinivorans DSM 11115]